MVDATVSTLAIHPIKGCRRIDVETVAVTATGLAHDREWQVAAGLKPVTQRQKAELAVVQPELIDGGLRLTAPGLDPIEVERPTVNDTTTGSLVGVKVEVADAGDEAARWFSNLVGDDVRLVAATDASRLDVPRAIDVFSQPIAFTDVAPVSVANAASYRWLVERAIEPFPIERFRSNVVVETDQPFVEDTWAHFSIGDAHLSHGLIWPRCAVPQVDQDSGERTREPALVLKAHRWCSEAPTLAEGVRAIVEGKGIFAIGCGIAPVGATISIGDSVEVHETMAPILASPA